MKTLIPSSKRTTAAASAANGRVSPPERPKNGVDHPALQAASAAIEETKRRAAVSAGVTIEEFARLPAHEQNAFMAQARGDQRPEAKAAENRVRMEPTSAFRRSPFNRSTFDPVKEKEMVDSIREHGIIENLIARPMSLYRQVVAFCRKMWAFKKPLKLNEILPALRATGVEISGIQFDFAFELLKQEKRLVFTKPLEAKELWEIGEGAMQPLKAKKLECESEWLEIVAGERRWNGAKVVGCECPVTVREMSDAEALEIQAAENLNRDDLNAMDEAEKFRQMLEEYEIGGLTKGAAMEMVEKKTQRKKATIYERLSLLGLPQTAIDLTKEGRLPASHAALLAKIPDPKVAESIAKQIVNPESWEDNGSGILPFQRAKELVDDEAKFIANCAKWQAKKVQFEKKGLRVLTVDESKHVLPHGDSVRYGSGYVKGSDTCQLDGQYRDYSKLWGKLRPPPILGRAAKGAPVEIFLKKEADAAVKSAGILKATESASDNRERAAARKAEEKRVAQMNELVAKIEGQNAASGKSIWAAVAQMLGHHLHSDTCHVICKRRNLEHGKHRQRDAVDELIEGLKTERECQALVIEALIGGGAYHSEDHLALARKTFGFQTSGK